MWSSSFPADFYFPQRYCLAKSENNRVISSGACRFLTEDRRSFGAKCVHCLLCLLGKMSDSLSDDCRGNAEGLNKAARRPVLSSTCNIKYMLDTKHAKNGSASAVHTGKNDSNAGKQTVPPLFSVNISFSPPPPFLNFFSFFFFLSFFLSPAPPFFSLFLNRQHVYILCTLINVRSTAEDCFLYL